MVRLFFFTFFVLSGIIAFGQSIEKRIYNRIDSLRFTGVDTFMTYSLSCYGAWIPIDTCTGASQYLFWIQGSKTFIEKFECNKNSKAGLSDTINPVSFYLSNKKQIDKEEIKSPTYIQSRKRKRVVEVSSTVSHQCFYKMTFILNGSKVFKMIGDYDLGFEKFDNGIKNMYYEYNQKSKLKALVDTVIQAVEEIDVISSSNNNE